MIGMHRNNAYINDYSRGDGVCVEPTDDVLHRTLRTQLVRRNFALTLIKER